MADTHLLAHLQLFFSGRKYFMAAKEPASLRPKKKKFLKMPQRTTKNKKTNRWTVATDTADTDTGDKKALAITAALRYGGGSGNINSCAINKHCAGRQFSVSNPPQRKAANRCNFKDQ